MYKNPTQLSHIEKDFLIERMAKTFNHDAKIMRQVRKLLLKNEPETPDPACSCSICELIDVSPATNKLFSALTLGTCLFLASLILIFACMAGTAHAETVIEGYSLDQWANSIRHAEGNSNYGILAHYKHTSYRQACKNTVRHSALQWARNGRKGTFLASLQQRYCPIGSNTDNGTCQYWASNVAYWLKRV